MILPQGFCEDQETLAQFMKDFSQLELIGTSYVCHKEYISKILEHFKPISKQLAGEKVRNGENPFEQ